MTPALQKRTFLLLAAVCLLTFAAAPLRVAIVAVLVIHALRGARQTIEAFTVGMFLLYLNPSLFHSLSGASTLRWPLIFGAFARVVWDLARHREAFWKGAAVPLLLAFTLCAMLFAPITSHFPQISFMKAITFFVGTFTILTAFRLTADQHEYWQGWFATFYVFLVLGSLPLLRFSGAYIGGLFMGLVNHSQAMGTFLVPFTGWLTFVLIRAERRPIVLSLTVLVGWYFIYLSGSRTSLVATAGAIALASLVTLVRGGVGRDLWLAGVRKLALPFLVVAITAAGVAGPQLADAFHAFMLKGEQGASVDEAFENSRGAFIEQQMDNWRRSPIIGIGFGAPSTNDDLRIKDSGFLGLPSGASVEKGFLPSAVLEEMGLVGGFLVLIITLTLLVRTFHQPDPALIALFLGGLLINVGEMIFFSPAAGGMFMWMCIGLATTYPIAGEDALQRQRVVHRKPTSHFASRSLQAG